MRERLKQAAQAVPVLLLIGLWLAYEFRVITPADIPEDIRRIGSLVLSIAYAGFFSVLMLPAACITLAIPLSLLLGLLGIPEEKMKWVAIPIVIMGSTYLGYSLVFDTGVASDISTDCRPSGPGIYNDC